MKTHIVGGGKPAWFALAVGMGIAAPYQTQETVMTAEIKGTFQVKLTPVEQEEGDGAHLARMTIDKQYEGDLQAVGKGQMLSAMTTTDGSAGYVAIERVTGSLQGRQGSFVIQHNGTMTRGAPQLTITVIPDSGTGQLAGIGGTMTIDITEGVHYYTFAYQLPADP